MSVVVSYQEGRNIQNKSTPSCKERWDLEIPVHKRWTHAWDRPPCDTELRRTIHLMQEGRTVTQRYFVKYIRRRLQKIKLVLPPLYSVISLPEAKTTYKCSSSASVCGIASSGYCTKWIKWHESEIQLLLFVCDKQFGHSMFRFKLKAINRVIYICAYVCMYICVYIYTYIYIYRVKENSQHIAPYRGSFVLSHPSTFFHVLMMTVT